MKFGHRKIITAAMFVVFSLVFWGSLINVSFSQDNTKTWDKYTPLAPLPGTTEGNCVTDKNGKVSGCTIDIQTYIPGIFNLAIGIAGVLAVLMIIIGGVQYITTDAIEGKSDGKERIQNALWGLVLVLVSWVLLYTINPKLTVFDLNVETTTVVGTGGGDNLSSSGDYSGTGGAIGSEERSISSVNEEGYTVSKHVTITTYEDGAESYVIEESYDDKEGNIHFTRTTKSKDDVFSTKIYINDVLVSENESNPNYDFDTWNGG